MSSQQGLISRAHLLAIFLCVLRVPSVEAEPLADFYKGKQMTLLIGAGTGGGYDTYGRLVAAHIGRSIPGYPTVIQRNREGAGSIIAVNAAVHALPSDGTVIVGAERTVALLQIMGAKGVQYKAEELQWIGSLATEAGICAVTKRSGIKTFSDLFEKEVPVGGFGRNDSEMIPAVMNNTIGTKFRLIAGYPSSAPANLAMERGEIDGLCQSWATLKELSKDRITSGDVFPIVQMNVKSDPELDKLGVPMIFDFITPDRMKGGLTADDVKSLLNVWFATKVMGRPYLMAPKVPKERVEAVRAAFKQMIADEKFAADAKKQRREIELVEGHDIQAIVAKMAATPKVLLDKMEDLQTYKGQVGKAAIKSVVHTGKVSQTKDDGRQIVILHEGGTVMAKVSGSRTQLSVSGTTVPRQAIKVGMTCTFTYPGPDQEAASISCTP